LLLYVPSTRQIAISGDVICDENFASTVAETWRPSHDAQDLRPTASFIPDSYTVLEHTGDLLSQFVEGNATANNDQTETTSPFEEDIIHLDLISDPVEDSSEEEATEGQEECNEAPGNSDKSDGSLDKLKCRFVVRGDLQDTGMEDSWSPTAPFRSLKMFLADAARNRCRVHQLDFVGAFLQANVRGRIFVTLPKVYGDIGLS
jgi:hypothetical protein